MSSFQIYSITDYIHRDVSEKKFLFDSNVWLYILQPQKDKLTKEQLDYEDFFYEISQRAEIVVPFPLLSEVINTYLYKITLGEFIDQRGDRKENAREYTYLKHKFRISSKYREDQKRLFESLTIYLRSCDVITENINPALISQKLLNFPPVLPDFNDNYYYHLAKNNNYIIVTHDGDFLVKDVEIVTLNGYLLRKAKSR